MMYRTPRHPSRKPSTSVNNISSLTSRSWCQLSPPYCPITIMPSYDNFIGASLWVNDTICVSTNDIEYATDKSNPLQQPDVNDMRISELNEELEAYGVATIGLFEKSELEEALRVARKLPRPDIPLVETKKSERTSKKKKIRIEIEKVKNMKSSEIRYELQDHYNIHTVFFEKSEYAEALAMARVNEAIRIQKKELSKAAVPAASSAKSSSSFFPSLSGISNTVQNIQTVSALLQNSEQLVNNPEFSKIIQKAQSNPKVMEAAMDCMSNPNNFTKYQSDPEITMFLNELHKCV